VLMGTMSRFVRNSTVGNEPLTNRIEGGRE
jgi:hypothetical protein